jgi:hypothetical protein
VGRARGRGAAGALAAAALLAALGGCGGASTATETGPRSVATDTRSAPREHPRRPAPETVAPSHCGPGLPSCRASEGRIVYVERVDPDGDGDAHFVILDAQSITLPGLTSIDVRKGLRPRALPGVGDLISAAGPVQTGSYGQSQIHALELHVAAP